MSRLLTTKRDRECEICGDTKGKCRVTQDGDLRLCMNSLDSFSTPPGFKFIGFTKDKTWGQFIVDDSSTSPEDWESRKAEQQRQRDERERLEQERRAAAMPAAERDTWYRKILDSLPLGYADWKDLRQRGFTDEQIERGGFKSVEKWQQLDFELPANLPGVNLNGRSLNIPCAGYLCPIKDENGLIVGMQVRTRNPEPDQPKYYWLTSKTKKRPNGPTPHLSNGELPLAIHVPEVITEAAIALVEGVGAKPFILSQRLEVVTIGAAGGQFASSPETLKHSLEVLSAELGTHTIEFYPDAGAILNPQVLRQYRATWKLLRQWGYEVQILWWGQETKDGSDIDELQDLSQLQRLTIAQFETLARPRLNWLDQIKQALQRRYTPSQSAAALEQVLTDRQKPAELEGVDYGEGDRHRTWQQAITQGYRYILDLSPPGSGKSFDAGQMDPAQLEGIRQLIYVSDQHRNPTVETLGAANGWVDLEARHGGLVTETTPGGGSRSKRAGQGETPSSAPNCNRIQLIETFRDKHVQGADTAKVICQTCPLRETCAHAEGPGYGFLHQRRVALGSAKLRSHPDSLPKPQEYDFSSTLLIWDEPGQSFTVKRTVQVRFKDIEQLLPVLVKHPDLFQPLQELLSILLDCVNGQTKTGKFGLSHAEVVQLLPDVSSINMAGLERVLNPDLSFLNTTREHGVDLADLPPSLRKKFSEKDTEMATRADQQILKQWLPDLLKILQGSIRGTLHLNRGTLTLTLPDTRHSTQAQAAKAVIFLDATLSRQDLALKLGCQPEDIYLCRQAVPTGTNLTLTQVVDLGRLGMQRGNQQQQRAAAIIAHYQTLDSQTKVIDFKKFAGEGTGAWWRDSRGSNDFEQDPILILVGTPCRNLADLLAEYAILTGSYALEDAGFQAFVDRAIRADFQQAIGRLRAHRRLEEPLQVIILSDFDLGLPGVQQVKASRITPSAADKFEIFTLAVQQAAQQLQAEGKKVTQSAIAALTEYSQQYISRYWKLLLSLLGISHSKSSKKPDPGSQDLVEVLEHSLPLCQTQEQVLEIVRDVFMDWSEPFQWQAIWRFLSIQSRIRILSALLLTLPSADLLKMS